MILTMGTIGVFNLPKILEDHKNTKRLPFSMFFISDLNRQCVYNPSDFVSWSI